MPHAFSTRSARSASSSSRTDIAEDIEPIVSQNVVRLSVVEMGGHLSPTEPCHGSSKASKGVRKLECRRVVIHRYHLAVDKHRRMVVGRAKRFSPTAKANLVSLRVTNVPLRLERAVFGVHPHTRPGLRRKTPPMRPTRACRRVGVGACRPFRRRRVHRATSNRWGSCQN